MCDLQGARTERKNREISPVPAVISMAFSLIVGWKQEGRGQRAGIFPKLRSECVFRHRRALASLWQRELAP